MVSRRGEEEGAEGVMETNVSTEPPTMQKPQMVPLTLEGTKIPGAHCHGEKTKGRNESMQVNIMRLLVVLNGHFLVGYENNFVVDIFSRDCLINVYEEWLFLVCLFFQHSLFDAKQVVRLFYVSDGKEVQVGGFGD